MKTRVDASLATEIARFALRFACEDCAHFDADGDCCSHGYPAAPRRSDRLRDELVFCKDFDLGAPP